MSAVCPHRCLEAYTILSIPSSPSGSHPPGTARPFPISFPLPPDDPSSSEYLENRQAPPGTTATSYKLGEVWPLSLSLYICTMEMKQLLPWETGERVNNKIQVKNSAAK